MYYIPYLIASTIFVNERAFTFLFLEAVGWVNVASLTEGATCTTNQTVVHPTNGFRYSCSLALDGKFQDYSGWAPGVYPAYMEVWIPPIFYSDSIRGIYTTELITSLEIWEYVMTTARALYFDSDVFVM